jgi:5'-3' exonuclease
VLEQEEDIESKLNLNDESNQRSIKENHMFMSNFVNTYKDDATAAKRTYYMSKLEFDLSEPKGRQDLKKLLVTYLEGMQWVLLYYYKGAPHWRWYYPYHYAPLISDLGGNIVQDFLDGKKVIKEFKTDQHCSEVKIPYTPFQ